MNNDEIKDKSITIDTPEHLDLRSGDIAQSRQQGLLQIFPEARTEGGKVDFDRLKLALGEIVDVGKERYGMNWPGKAECFKTIQASSMGTLRPCPEESVNFDTTEHLFIEGDNLEVLKLLQKSYLGKIKMIYIDPPYNTGNDFIYPDNYTESLQTYLEYTGQVDSRGKKFGTNTETDGRFHSKWLNMMWPRLYLARNLLSDDGVIFISIDDNEVENCIRLLNEVFGEENFLARIIIQSNKRGQTYKQIAKTHEYLIVYSKREVVELNEFEKAADSLPFKDSNGQFDLWELRNRNPKFGRFNRPNLFFPIYVLPSSVDECGYSRISLTPRADDCIKVVPLNTEGVEGCWRWGTDKIKQCQLDSKSPQLVARQRRDGGWNIYEKSRKSTTKAKSIWTDNELISEQGTIELGRLEMADAFDHPKPLALVQRCIFMATSPGELVLDFFSGSGTTGHAIFAQNVLDTYNRKFILVQLPERTDNKNYATIADITKERLRKAGENIQKVNPMFAGDLGFRVFKLAESNFKPWNADVPHNATSLKQQLEFHIDHIKEGRTELDLLYEILLKSSYPLTASVELLEIESKKVYNIAEGLFLICLEKELTLAVIRAMADLKPERVVCLDEGFARNDQLKANAVQIFKSKGVNSFKTV